MCGIVGVVRLDEQPVTSSSIAKMSAQVAHRGPDGDGIWVDGPVGLGHRRLSIIDLTASGHQPMSNEDGKILITYNGELYNFQQLRVELEAKGHRFHSQTDTEVVIHAYEEWGESCLDRFNGMFAFAIWDRNAKRLFIARDRYGVKPLYYFCDGAKFVFASEIKPILSYPGIPRSISYDALNEYFTFQNILSDLTLFSGIHLLRPGHYLTVDSLNNGNIRQRQYWDYPLHATPLQLSEEEAAEELSRLFAQAVTRQLISDVPIACYLSGGMDSSSITTVARRQLGRLMTFTCGFDLSSASGMELGFDERARAELISNMLKTEHYEVVLHAGDMEHIMPELISSLEDLRVGQCYPNYYVARLASKFVKVVLSGAGGDELFAGYPWRYYRTVSSNGIGDYFRNYYSFWQRLVPDEDKSALFVPEVMQAVKHRPTFDVFRSVFDGAHLPLKTQGDFVSAALYFELKTFLHGLFVVEDRVSMAHSLETRVPFMDNDLVDFACRLPSHFKLRDLQQNSPSIDENQISKYYSTSDGKIILRTAMKSIIAPEVADRVKQGFSAPDASWFRGESIDYVSQLLRNPRAEIYNFLNPPFVERMLDQHMAGQHNHRLLIWSLLSLEWWARKFLSSHMP